MKKSYQELLKDPRWQKKRLEVMKEHGFQCDSCGSKTETLNIHHGYYGKDMMPWDYTKKSYHCLCDTCHYHRHNLEDDIRFHLSTWNEKKLTELLFSISGF
jgi:hypothetical protein